MRRCGLNGSDGQQGEDRSGVDPVKALRRLLRFRCHRTLKPGSALQRRRAPIERATVSPARIMLTASPTWTGAWGFPTPALTPLRPPAGCRSEPQLIRLRSDMANPLNRRRNSWADGDRCVPGLALGRAAAEHPSRPRCELTR